MKGAWILGLAAGALFAALAWMLAPLEPSVLALQFAYTAPAFGQVIHAWSPAQLALFRAHLPWDMLLLLLYGAFGHRLVSRSAAWQRRDPGLRTMARWALPTAAFFDASENAWHAWLTAAPRLDAAWAYPLAAGCATLKWVALLGFAALLAWAAWSAARADDRPPPAPPG